MALDEKQMLSRPQGRWKERVRAVVCRWFQEASSSRNWDVAYGEVEGSLVQGFWVCQFICLEDWGKPNSLLRKNSVNIKGKRTEAQNEVQKTMQGEVDRGGAQEPWWWLSLHGPRLATQNNSCLPKDGQSSVGVALIGKGDPSPWQCREVTLRHSHRFSQPWALEVRMWA